MADMNRYFQTTLTYRTAAVPEHPAWDFFMMNDLQFFTSRKGLQLCR